MVPSLRSAFAQHLEWLERELADGRPFLGGDAPGHGDLAHFMLVWFAARGGPFDAVAPALTPWARRVAEVGHGHPTPLTAEAALAAARAATPSFTTGGRPVAVRQEGSQDPPVEGRLAAEDATGFWIVRHHPQTGCVAVRFPWEGQILEDA